MKKKQCSDCGRYEVDREGVCLACWAENSSHDWYVYDEEYTFEDEAEVREYIRIERNKYISVPALIIKLHHLADKIHSSNAEGRLTIMQAIDKIDELEQDLCSYQNDSRRL